MNQGLAERVGRSVGTALIALFLAPHVHAQPANGGVAHLKQVTGNVLVSRESGLAAADEAVPLTKGMRVITTSNAEAIVVYDNGCEVRLKPNQRFEVATGKACAALIALVESVLPEAAGAAASGLTPVLLAPAFNAGVFGVAALLLDRQGTKVSPN